MKTGSTSGVINVSGGTLLSGVIDAMYLNGSSSHVGLTIIYSGTGTGIGAVCVSTVGTTGVKYGDLGRGIAEASGMPKCTGMSECIGIASGMAEPIGIVEDHAKIAESSWMPSRMAQAIEMNEAIIADGACWVVGAIGLAEASGMLMKMSIPSKNNWNIGETLLSCKSFNHQTVSHFLHAMLQSKK
jgi:hypothetical protein